MCYPCCLILLGLGLVLIEMVGKEVVYRARKCTFECPAESPDNVCEACYEMFKHLELDQGLKGIVKQENSVEEDKGIVDILGVGMIDGEEEDEDHFESVNESKSNSPAMSEKEKNH